MVGAKRAGFTSKGGTFLQGAILDQDKLDVSGTIKVLKDVGYTGDIATEFRAWKTVSTPAPSTFKTQRMLQEA